MVLYKVEKLACHPEVTKGLRLKILRKTLRRDTPQGTVATVAQNGSIS